MLHVQTQSAGRLCEFIASEGEDKGKGDGAQDLGAADGGKVEDDADAS